LRSSDFRRRACEEFQLQRAGDPGRVGHALGSHASLPVETLPGDAGHEIIQQRVTGPGVAGDQRVVAIDIADVGNAADIDHNDRPLALQRLRQRAVIDRNERRALPAGRDVGGAEIVHHGNMDGLGKRRRVADLHGEPAVGPVQHGLAVEADDVDILAGDAVLRPER